MSASSVFNGFTILFVVALITPFLMSFTGNLNVILVAASLAAAAFISFLLTNHFDKKEKSAYVEQILSRY